jgi:hypothetical protein
MEQINEIVVLVVATMTVSVLSVFWRNTYGVGQMRDGSNTAGYGPPWLMSEKPRCSDEGMEAARDDLSSHAC